MNAGHVSILCQPDTMRVQITGYALRCVKRLSKVTLV